MVTNGWKSSDAIKWCHLDNSNYVYVLYNFPIRYPIATLRNRVKNLSVAVDCLYYLQMIIFFALLFGGKWYRPTLHTGLHGHFHQVVHRYL